MNKDGFTLIELIVSLAIMGLIVVTILPIINTGLSNIIYSGNRTEAVSLANDDIFNNTEKENFSIVVKLPDKVSDDIDVIIEGNIITGTSNISGRSDSKVELYIYRPNTL